MAKAPPAKPKSSFADWFRNLASSKPKPKAGARPAASAASTMTNLPAGGGPETRPGGPTSSHGRGRGQEGDHHGQALQHRGVLAAADRAPAGHHADERAGHRRAGPGGPHRAHGVRRRHGALAERHVRDGGRADAVPHAAPREGREPRGPRPAAARSRRCRTAATSSRTTSRSSRTGGFAFGVDVPSAATTDELKSRLEELAPALAGIVQGRLGHPRRAERPRRPRAEHRADPPRFRGDGHDLAGAHGPHGPVGLAARPGAARQPAHVPRRAPRAADRRRSSGAETIDPEVPFLIGKDTNDLRDLLKALDAGSDALAILPIRDTRDAREARRAQEAVRRLREEREPDPARAAEARDGAPGGRPARGGLRAAAERGRTPPGRAAGREVGRHAGRGGRLRRPCSSSCSC